MSALNPVFFWIAVVLCVISVYRMYLSKKLPVIAPGELHLSERSYRLLLLLVVLTAVAVRVYQFGLIPGGVNQDGAMAAVDARALADYGTDRFGMKFPIHLTAWGYGQMSTMLSWLMIPFIRLFGLNTVTMRLPQLIVSLAGLLCLYLFIRNMFGKYAALAVLSFAAVNPWHILQSRWALDCNLFPHFFLAGLFLLHRALMNRIHRGLLCASMILFGLCMYCYGVSLYTVPVFLLGACLYLICSRTISPGHAVLAFLVYLSTAWPFIAVMAINFFGLESIEVFRLFTLPRFPASVRSHDILFFSGDIPGQLIDNCRSLVNITLLQKKDLPWNDLEGFGSMYLFSIPFGITGLISLLRVFRRKTGAKLILLFLLSGIWCGLITGNVNINRLNIIYYPIMILSGLGIYQVFRWIPRPPVRWGVAMAYLLSFALFTHTYFTSYAREIRYWFFGDFCEAVSALKESGAEKYYITPDCRQEGASPASEILTLFRHEIDAEYFQGKNTPPGELSYQEKYVFRLTRDLQINPLEDAAYVIRSEDLALFDESLFEFEQFGAYDMVTPK